MPTSVSGAGSGILTTKLLAPVAERAADEKVAAKIKTRSAFMVIPPQDERVDQSVCWRIKAARIAPRRKFKRLASDALRFVKRADKTGTRRLRRTDRSMPARSS